MKRIMMLLMAVGFLCVVAMPVHAEDGGEKKAKKVKKEKAPKAPKEKKAKPEGEKAKKEKAAKPVAEEMTISGVITKEEVKKGEKVTVKYTLTDTEGNKISLPAPKKSKDGETIKLEDYVDAAVKVTGTGSKEQKKGKDVIVLKSLTAIVKGDGAADVEVFPKDDEEAGDEAAE